MLKIHFILGWFGCFDRVMEEGLHDISLQCRFFGLDVFEQMMPGERAMLQSRALQLCTRVVS